VTSGGGKLRHREFVHLQVERVIGDETDHEVVAVDAVAAEHAPSAQRAEQAKDLTEVGDELAWRLHRCSRVGFRTGVCPDDAVRLAMWPASTA
jgi:hypothetical protein